MGDALAKPEKPEAMSARGRKVGELQNPRDERGWMIPRAGTRRRAVYDALVAGEGVGLAGRRMSATPLLDWTPPLSPPDGVPADVCLTFEKLANQLRGLGFERYSADAILHRVRWEWQVERGDRGFRCDNNWTAPLARWFLARNPAAKGFFELRTARAAPVRSYAD